MTKNKVNALAKELEVTVEDVLILDENKFEVNGSEFFVLTESQRDEFAKDYILDSLWAFNASFLSETTGIDEIIFTKLAELNENANSGLKAIIKSTCGLEEFVEETTSADGHGYFIATYDGEEMKLENDFYAYQIS